MLYLFQALCAASKKEYGVRVHFACGAGLRFLANIGKWLHGEIDDSTAASAYKVIMQAGVCVEVVLAITKGELLDFP